MKKKLYYITVSFIILLLVAACGNNSTQSASNSTATDSDSSEGKEYVFKISHIGANNHIWTPTMEKFNEELASKSNGRLSLEIYTDAVLGNDAELMEQLNAGTLDMAWINSAALANYSDSFNGWFMPFLIDSPELAFKLAETDEGKAILETIEDFGVHGLGYTFIEMRGLLMKDTMIESISDIEGKKIRVTPSPVMVDWYETIGAIPTPIPLPELFSSFQTGVIDGIDQGAVGIIGSKFYEISKNYTMSNHMIFNGGALVSKKVWESLAQEDQEIIEAAFQAAQQYNLELSKSWEKDNLDEFAQLGGNVADIADKSGLLEKANAFYEKYANQDEKIAALIEKAKELKSK